MLWQLTGTLVNVGWHWHGAGPVMISRFGEAALPGMLKLVRTLPNVGSPAGQRPACGRLGGQEEQRWQR